VTPGAYTGQVHLFFQAEPTHDIIWPQWGVDFFISDRVKDLLKQNGVRGLRYHPVAGARIIGEKPFRKLVKQWRWRPELFRKNIPPDAGRPARTTFYEIEVLGQPADCGLRWQIVCPVCGFDRHDVRKARTSGPVGNYPEQDMFNMRGLGRPVCTHRLVDLLGRAEVRLYELHSVSELIASIIKDVREQSDEISSLIKEIGDNIKRKGERGIKNN
jgi:rubredoxin